MATEINDTGPLPSDDTRTNRHSTSSDTREISLGDDFCAMVVKGSDFILERDEKGNITINAQGNITACTDGTVQTQSPSFRFTPRAWRQDLAAKAATHEIGAIESNGEHKGEIYGGIFPDGKPGWILEEPNPLTHYEASELKGRALPTSKEGKYIDTIKDKGALKDIFSRHSDSSSSAGFFWLAERNVNYARFQQFSVGSQGANLNRGDHLPVLCVLR